MMNYTFGTGCLASYTTIHLNDYRSNWLPFFSCGSKKKTLELRKDMPKNGFQVIWGLFLKLNIFSPEFEM